MERPLEVTFILLTEIRLCCGLSEPKKEVKSEISAESAKLNSLKFSYNNPKIY